MNQRTILLAEDDPSILLHTSETLEEKGFNILKAVNGKEASVLAAEKIPDLILLDWGMPVMDGMEALLKIKADPATSGIPVIIVTGQMTSRENLSTAFEAGAIDFIRKPFDKTELLARINSVLKMEEYHQQTINLKNRELASAALSLAHNCEINNLLTARLDKIKNLAKKQSLGMLSAINEMVEDIATIRETNSWEQFNDHFLLINPAFGNTLLAKHPDLSPSEIKLCMLLRLNISTKEIAAIACQTYDSIRVSRTRLRKKLDLDNEDGLVIYLMKV